MTTTADNLRDLHGLHQRAKSLRDRLESGPKTLASRQALLANRQEALEDARKALKESKAQGKLKETQVQSLQTKLEDLRAKRNQVRKQDEYNALTHQIHHDEKSVERLEGEILEGMEQNDQAAAELATQEAEVKKLEAEVAALKTELEAKAEGQKNQLAELDRAIAEAERIIPADQRERYRRNIKQRGADALAAVENGACTGCFVSVTAQMLNELINADNLVFCNTCGRLLYLSEDQARSAR